MKKVLFILFSIILCSTATYAKSERLYTDSELDSYKARITEKVEKDLSNYLGKIKFSVFLKINSKNIEPKKTKIQLSSLYLLDNQSYEKESGPVANIAIENIESKVVVYELLNNSLNKEIQEIVSSALDDIKSSVKVSYMESTKSLSDVPAPAPEPTPEPVQPPATPEVSKEEAKDLSTFMQDVLGKHFPEFMRLIGVLILALVAIIGVIIFARLLRTPLNTIAESFKNFSAKYANADSKDKKEKSEAEVVDHKEITEKFKEHLVVLKQVLEDKPLEVASFVIENEINAAGFKKILPYVHEKKYGDLIKNNFNEKHFSMIKNSAFQFSSNIAFFEWFEATIETLTVLSLKNHISVLSCIPKSQIELMKKISKPVLKNYLLDNSSSTSYQVIMDLLQGDDRDIFLKDLDIDEWKVAFEVSDISDIEILAEVENIIKFSSVTHKHDDLVTASEINSTLIIPSLLSVLSLTRLKSQDSFLDSLSSVSEDSIKNIREDFWTPRDLLAIPQTYLRECFRKIDVTNKAMIIHAMPEDIGDFLLSGSIEGKAKEIVKDILQSKTTFLNDEASEKVAKELIKELLAAYKNKEFELLNHGKEIERFNQILHVEEDELDSDDFVLDSADELDDDLDAA